MKKILAALLCAIMLVGCLAGCGSSSSNKVQVGIVLPTKDEPRWLQDQASFEKLLGDAGFTSQVLFSQGSSATEKTNVETLVTNGIDVLIICAQDASAAAAAVESAKAAGVTVICYDRLITNTDAVDYYVTFDSVAVGEAQAQYLVDNKPAGSGIPLYLYAGAATDNNAFLFFEGAWNVLQPYIADGTFVIANSSEAVALQDKAELTYEEKSAIIGQVTTDWDFNVAKTKAEAHLTAADASAKGDVLILAPNDGTSRAIADAFSADSDITSYVITGQDAELASINYIYNGKQSMTVFKNTATLAADSVAMASSILNKQSVATDTTYNNQTIDVPSKQTPVTVITKDNLEEILVTETGTFTMDQIIAGE